VWEKGEDKRVFIGGTFMLEGKRAVKEVRERVSFDKKDFGRTKNGWERRGEDTVLKLTNGVK